MKKDQFSKLVILLLIFASTSFPEAHGQSGREILEQTGVKGGLIVHIDCGDGRLTAALLKTRRIRSGYSHNNWYKKSGQARNCR